MKPKADQAPLAYEPNRTDHREAEHKRKIKRPECECRIRRLMVKSGCVPNVADGSVFPRIADLV